LIRVTFLVHSLRVGGAEVQLSALARGLDRDAFEPTIISFYDDGDLIEELRDAGINVITLNMRGRRGLGGFLWRLVRAVRGSRPDVLYSFLDFPNVVAAFLKPLIRGSRLIWGIRASDMRLEERDRTWRAVFRLERLLAGAADVIICNSWAGRRHLEACNFPQAAMTVVSNGFDTDRFGPDAAVRERARAEFGFSEAHIVIGLVARIDPMKDHTTFLKAAAELVRDMPSARFICIGGGPGPYTDELRALGVSLGLGDRLVWAGPRHDVPELLNAFDIATLSSAYGEGFPNSIGEGMATALPTVTTDVGDAARVVGDTGAVVPIGSASGLAVAWRRMAELPAPERASIGVAARARVISCFPRMTMIKETSDLLRRIELKTTDRAVARETS